MPLAAPSPVLPGPVPAILFLRPGTSSMEPAPRDELILDPWDDDPTSPARAPRPRPRRPPLRITTRGLMLGLAVLTVEAVILAEAHRLGPGIEFTLFIGAVLGTLDVLVPGYLGVADRINSAPPERQGAELLHLGCLLGLLVLLTLPISLLIFVSAGGR